ncbi:PspC domain-containing protein [Streptococcus sp. 121]|nr:PspC domain-containing protein [Streptococcus sp. 121]MBJ6745914.1 PspC domain-containing protein [Streptococcus sp. 121]
MMTKYYKMRKGKIVSGVLAGLADKFRIDPTLARVLYVLFLLLTDGWALFLYILLSAILPYKEDLIEYDDEVTYKDGRRRKTAEPIEEDDWTW